MLDQSDPGPEPKLKDGAPTPQPRPEPIRLEGDWGRPRGNRTLWALLAGAAVVIVILLGMLAHRPGGPG